MEGQQLVEEKLKEVAKELLALRAEHGRLKNEYDVAVENVSLLAQERDEALRTIAEQKAEIDALKTRSLVQSLRPDPATLKARRKTLAARRKTGAVASRKGVAKSRQRPTTATSAGDADDGDGSDVAPDHAALAAAKTERRKEREREREDRRAAGVQPPATATVATGERAGAYRPTGSGLELMALSPAANYRLDKAFKTGWLRKRGGKTFTPFRRRFFVCRDAYVFYYKSESDIAPTGYIPLDGCALVAKAASAGHYPFDIVHATRRNFVLEAASESEREDWMMVLSNRIVAVAAELEYERVVEEHRVAATSPSGEYANHPGLTQLQRPRKASIAAHVVTPAMRRAISEQSRRLTERRMSATAAASTAAAASATAAAATGAGTTAAVAPSRHTLGTLNTMVANWQSKSHLGGGTVHERALAQAASEFAYLLEESAKLRGHGDAAAADRIDAIRDGLVVDYASSAFPPPAPVS
ncbi:uncharacterized protein AMSG_10643 [Thecamonas trahens ATCC 50062]|uniref:PH domain-containing protein n=1 Tax=Thecamonas trahens ATCC 50062 TaxID=461836 RepID=A0A0L0DS26_THETB|nr:hypothetical protein AMSG_10643 [Thecamonas trahens ATCC 50062]KNC55047.1 hypothetical protein AMSG_10643 [Thecamonas trahens ATCC 50062]|eukprot:XP_013753351.1 hypothetical protein AMSG_10643 [Thecamonas trahens ATCC 50062]